jgi:hypothetical protein
MGNRFRSSTITNISKIEGRALGFNVSRHLLLGRETLEQLLRPLSNDSLNNGLSQFFGERERERESSKVLDPHFFEGNI